MSVISTPPGCVRLNKRLERADSPYWIAESSGDKWGKYLVFHKGGGCVGGAGWSLREAAEKVDDIIAGRWESAACE